MDDMKQTESVPAEQALTRVNTSPPESDAQEPVSKPPPFARGLNFYQLFWIFFIGCFLGVVIETIWCLLTRHHFESRKGLIYGPFNLVYGFGALAMTLGLHWLSKKRDFYVFLGGFVIGSVFEYLCSWMQEAVFGTVSWEYGKMPFNINGRINLLYSIFWGLLALFWVKGIYPMMCRWISKIPNKIGKPLTWVLLVFMIVNSAVSGLAVYRMSERREGLAPSNALEEHLDDWYPDEMLHKVYPNMMIKPEKPEQK